MGNFDVTVSKGRAVLTKKGRSAPVARPTSPAEPAPPAETVVDSEGTEVVTPETPTEPAPTPADKRRKSSE